MRRNNSKHIGTGPSSDTTFLQRLEGVSAQGGGIYCNVPGDKPGLFLVKFFYRREWFPVLGWCLREWWYLYLTPNNTVCTYRLSKYQVYNLKRQNIRYVHR